MYRSQTPPRSLSFDNSPPSTPLSQIARSGRGSRVVDGAAADHYGNSRGRGRHTVREAFDDSIARDAGGMSSRESSNSHDLSWSPNRQRVSVVDNMLLSLDQFPPTSHPHQLDQGTSSQFYGDDSYPPEPSYTAPEPLGRPRGHTGSSSMNSSDYAPSADTQLASQTRGHRSNSNGNYQSTLGRIDSVRLADEAAAAAADEHQLHQSYQEGAYERIRPAAPAVNKATGPSARARKSSKGSGSSSFDLGETNSRRWRQQASERRSTSFDQGFSRPDFVTQIVKNNAAYSKQQALFYDSLDAAPTPTVPVGPRRGVSPSGSVGYRPVSSLAANQKTGLRRRGSIKSPLAFWNNRPERNDGMEYPYDPSAQRKSSVHQRSGSGGGALRNDSVGGGYVPYGQESPMASVPNLPVVGKENQRPGFFKRVFGSRPGQASSEQLPLQARSERANQNNSIVRDGSNQHPSPPVNPPPPPPTNKLAKTSSAPAAKESRGQSSAGKEQPAHPLNKKTSFFRRRKKSLSAPAPLPSPPLQLQAQLQSQDLPPAQADEQQSPVSSLRQVMNPYLHTPSRSLNQELHGAFKDIDPQAAKGDEPQDSRTRPTIRTVYSTDGTDNNILLPPTSQEPVLFATDQSASSTSKKHASPPATPRDKRTPTKSDRARSSIENQIQSIVTPGTNSRSNESRQPTNASSLPTASGDSNRETFASRARKQSDVDRPLPNLPGSWPTAKTGSTPVSPQDETENAPLEPASSNSKPVAADKAPDPTRDADSSPHLQLVSSESEERFEDAKVVQTPTEKSPAEVFQSSISKATDFQTGPSEAAPRLLDTSDAPLVNEPPEAAELDPNSPSAEDRLKAEKLFYEDSEIGKLNAAAWLGEAGIERSRVRKAYMELFDWHGMSILAAMRSFCSQLKVKGETQQVDRLLDALSMRWCECNPNHGFKATDVVHTICYSILLLNTDLHMADIDSKMTRGQFIKNTLPTIQRVVADAAPNAFDNSRGSMLPPPRRQESKDDAGGSADAAGGQESTRPVNALATRPSDYSGSEPSSSIPATPFDETEDCGPLVLAPFHGKMAAWELQVEVVLKNFYNSIRQTRLPLSGNDQTKSSDAHPSSASLSAMTGSMLRRTNSVLSKAGSESLPARGRMMDSRMGSRWSSKTRSRPRLYPSSLGQSSRTSFDDDASAASPSASSMWTKQSVGKTQTSMSVNSVSSAFPHNDYKQSIGFANALSQAIIREESATDGPEETMRVGPLLEDESLELAGPPWAKEGILKHKHHLESVDKRAKDRNWAECFAVIEKGYMRLFQFNVNARSMRAKARNQKMPGGVVGGGNWTENAEPIGTYLLRQSIASALPPPGYSKARPHVWALSLPSGAVHLFQAGTPEIVKEFVSSANYWSARMSKEPLVGGISNIEYGWSENVITPAFMAAAATNNSSDDRTSLSYGGPRPSFQASIRSSIDHGSAARPRLPGDRLIINDWTPPPQSMLPSQLLEVDQLRALSTYVKNVEEELRRHNELRGPMLLAFTPRHPNHSKAMQNWERKSSYLLREIVKFSTYIDSLQGAQASKAKVYAERQERERKKEERVKETEKEMGSGRPMGDDVVKSQNTVST